MEKKSLDELLNLCPSVFGVIVSAWMEQENMPDILHVKGVDVADDIGNLDRINGLFVLMGKSGILRHHGFGSENELIGKRCVIFSGGKSDRVAIEPKNGTHWDIITWCEYL